MLSFEKLVEQENIKAHKSYRNSLEKIKIIWDDLKDDEDKYQQYLFAIADKIICYAKLEKEINDEYYLQNSLEALKNKNQELFSEIKPENYNKSYANPENCVEIFGEEFGPLLSAYYINYRNYVTFSFQHMQYYMRRWNNVFIEVYKLFKIGFPVFNECKALMMKEFKNVSKEDTIMNFSKSYGPETKMYRDIVMKANLADRRYLYQYGKPIGDNELKSAEFLSNYPIEKIDILAKSIAKAFIRGYELAKKDLSIKKTLNIYYHLGQEKIARAIVKELEKNDLKVLLNMVFTTSPNRQYHYDHRFDNALYLDDALVGNVADALKTATAECGDFLKEFAGPIYFDTFGETPFAPVNKPACLKLSVEQQQLSQKMNIQRNQIMDNYISRSTTSFCIVGFPLPEIGEKFAEIFEETNAINMIDTIHHENIQQHIVDALDKADYVHVKGKNGNLTDIKVKMQLLEDPDKQTNFVNCGADVNIPVGEVFTSPTLAGTNGVLHLHKTFLKQLKFVDLNLKFKDGYVEDYSCGNFEKEEDNRKYIEENLLFPHKTLPIGEFAIGTNTLAYVMAKKFDILPLMPVLIVEKMGPHFAIGDTCFSWEEDSAVYNPIDNKEITARDNERSILRKEDVSKAYTNCHTDITLPYEDLDFITAVTADGEKIDIIRDGRFVVPGTEELNVPLDKWEGNE
ncbi:MAG: aminopeptidase [Candidatus Cloacimonetes bacterium]|nr:aminopeptidase [Candidatus Cloacimonadota bacterium]